MMLSLREHRISQGWSQRELARRADVSLGTIGAIESGYRQPKALTVMRIARALHVDPAEIIEFTLRGHLRAFVRRTDRKTSRVLKDLIASKDVRYPLSSILSERLREPASLEAPPGSPLDLALRELARRREAQSEGARPSVAQANEVEGPTGQEVHSLSRCRATPKEDAQDAVLR
jgi:transcriptional regulator with XRE-family HTH domain